MSFLRSSIASSSIATASQDAPCAKASRATCGAPCPYASAFTTAIICCGPVRMPANFPQIMRDRVKINLRPGSVRSVSRHIDAPLSAFPSDLPLLQHAARTAWLRDPRRFRGYIRRTAPDQRNGDQNPRGFRRNQRPKFPPEFPPERLRFRPSPFPDYRCR